MKLAHCNSICLALTIALASASTTHAQAPAANPMLGYAQGIQWGSDIDAAKAEAVKSGKLVLLHFWTPSCGPCRMLDQQVFNQPPVAGAVHSKFVPVKINADAAPALAQTYGITRVPTDVIVSAEGQVIERIVSPSSPMAYIGKVTQIAAEFETQAGRNFQQAAAQSPYAQAAAAAPPTNNPYANLNIPAAPAAQPQNAQPPVTPQAPPAQQVENRYAQGPASAPVAATQTPVAQPEPPVSQVADASKTPAKPQAAQLPPGAPPVGFEGFCPVTMKTKWQWQAGDVKWGAIHRGRTYLFVGQAERDEFLKDPDKFSPVLSGNDPVLAVEGGKSVPGSRQYALEYEGRFYLFSSEETLNKFWTNADGFANGVRQAMTQTGADRMVR